LDTLGFFLLSRLESRRLLKNTPDTLREPAQGERSYV
jgi:hypothetical protein